MKLPAQAIKLSDKSLVKRGSGNFSKNVFKIVPVTETSFNKPESTVPSLS